MSTGNNRVILGIDPGYDRLGWAVCTPTGNASAPITVLKLGCIQTERNSSLWQRYLTLGKELGVLMQENSPTEIAIETLFFSTNKKTALQVSEARGVIIAELLKYSSSLFEYHPRSIKLAVTGDGAADKKAIEKMIRLQVPNLSAQHLDDTLDAVAIAFTHVLTHTPVAGYN